MDRCIACIVLRGVFLMCCGLAVVIAGLGMYGIAYGKPQLASAAPGCGIIGERARQ